MFELRSAFSINAGQMRRIFLRGCQPLLFALAISGLASGGLRAAEADNTANQSQISNDCDRYAASEFDKQSPVPGRPFAKIDPKLAIPACLEAVSKAPDSVRFNFQLGRAYDANRQFSEARDYFLKAAQSNFALAQVNLASLYFNGQGVAQDYREAARWNCLAADQGLAPAQANLGAMYIRGQGVARDYAEAARLLNLAAAQGFAAAQNSLGALYASGKGVAQSFAEAVRYYRLAADQGYAPAQANLGAMYANGQGVERNYTEAMKWYGLATDQGYDSTPVAIARDSADEPPPASPPAIAPPPGAGYPPVKIVVTKSEAAGRQTTIEISPLSPEFSMTGFAVNKGRCQPYIEDPGSVSANDAVSREEALRKIAITPPPFNPPVAAKMGQSMTFYVDPGVCNLSEVEVTVNGREWKWPPELIRRRSAARRGGSFALRALTGS